MTELVDENQIRESQNNQHGGKVTANRNKKQALKEGWQQMMPLFHRPHGFRLIMVCVIQFGIMLGLNTLRLWLPQLYTTISDFGTSSAFDGDICDTLQKVEPINDSRECTVVSTQRHHHMTNKFIIISILYYKIFHSVRSF